jgi:hypothetical protein
MVLKFVISDLTLRNNGKLSNHRHLLEQFVFYKCEQNYRQSFILMQDSRGMFGAEHETNLLAHTIAVSGGPLGLPEYGAIYEGGQVEQNDGDTEYSLTVKVSKNLFPPVKLFYKNLISAFLKLKY